MSAETLVEFPRAMRDLFPVAAQQLYVETYKQSWAKSAEATGNELSREGAASRDAWNAVRREYIEDPTSHKWRRIDEPTAAPGVRSADRSLLGRLKGWFKR